MIGRHTQHLVDMSRRIGALGSRAGRSEADSIGFGPANHLASFAVDRRCCHAISAASLNTTRTPDRLLLTRTFLPFQGPVVGKPRRELRVFSSAPRELEIPGDIFLLWRLTIIRVPAMRLFTLSIVRHAQTGAPGNDEPLLSDKGLIRADAGWEDNK